MAKWKRPDAANEMRCEKCGMRFLREDVVPVHNVWGGRKAFPTRCDGSLKPPRRVKGSRRSVIRIVRVNATTKETEVRKILGLPQGPLC